MTAEDHLIHVIFVSAINTEVSTNLTLPSMITAKRSCQASSNLSPFIICTAEVLALTPNGAIKTIDNNLKNISF